MDLLLCFSQLCQFQGAATPALETRCVATPTAGLQCLEKRKKLSLGLSAGVFFRFEYHMGRILSLIEMGLCLLVCITLLIQD